MSLNAHEHSEAKKCCERAIEINSKCRGVDSLDISNSLSMLSTIHEMAGRHEEARQMQERAEAVHAAMRENNGESTHPVNILTGKPRKHKKQN